MTKPLSLRAIVGFAVPYGFVCASLYLYAYWHPMGLNPFHYANAADLVSATLGGIVVSFVLLFVGMAMGFISSPAMSRPPSDEPIKRGAVDTANAYAGMVIIPLLLGLTWWRGWPVKWIVAGGAIAIFIPLLLRGNNWYNITFPTHKDRFFVGLIAVVLPFAFFGQGAIAIDRATTIGAGMAIDVARSDLGVPVRGQVMYTGMLGDFHVLRELSTKSTLLVPAQTRVVLQETKFENPPSVPAVARPASQTPIEQPSKIPPAQAQDEKKNPPAQ